MSPLLTSFQFNQLEASIEFELNDLQAHAERVGGGYSEWQLSEEARVEASKQLDKAVDEMVRQEEGAWEQVRDEERESLLSQGRQCFDPMDSRFLFED